MVNTQSRPLVDGDLRDDSSPERDPVVRAATVIPSGMPPLLTGDVELGPRVVLTVMQMVTTTMEKQQEVFLKMLEDRDASLRRHGAVEENVLTGAGGSGGGVRAEKHRAFGSSECGDDQRVRFGTQLLRDTTLTWWNIVQSTLSPTVLAQLSWAEFKKKLLEEFCSERTMDRIEKEFWSLVKGNLTVREYTRQFMEKLDLVGHVAPTEKDKMKAYLNGLPADLLSLVHNSKASNLRDMVEEAQFMEELFLRSKAEKAVVVSDKRKWENSYVPPRRSRPFFGNRSFGSQQEAGWCCKCRTKHHGSCNAAPQSCYKCGKSDHISRDCPIRGLVCYECKAPGHVKRDFPKLVSSNALVKKENLPRVPGRAFQMTSEEAKTSADVVSGTFLLNSLPARVLFDTGASFSFVSELFCQKIAMPTTSLEDALVVEIADGSKVLIRDILKKCILGIEGT
ncbi:hypothetical protein L6452_40976 [Arctium lappa]|uniref:Uncharacterized protein n=1 Tax=Arctium lappa TaxID=4217 RepID=A0ACB8XNR0_ARCLA|nr:hypothetical protein L6452_40976 [Arctium lappa]